MDSWKTLAVAWLIILSETDGMPFPFPSGCREERPLVRQPFDISVLITYGVVQLDNY